MEARDTDDVERAASHLLQPQLLGHCEREASELERLFVLPGPHAYARKRPEHVVDRRRSGPASRQLRRSVEVLERGVVVTLLSVELAEHRLGFRGPIDVVVREEPFDGLLQHVAASVDRQEGPAVLKDQDRPLWIIRRPELECTFVEARRSGEGVERQRTVAGIAQGDPGARSERRGFLARGLGELERREVVVREHLGVILRAAERFDPLGGETMLRYPRRTRDLTVGDVSKQDVTERVLRLSLRGRVLIASNELPPLEPEHALLDGPAVLRRHRSDGAAPEDSADHCSVLDERLLVIRKAVETRGDDPVHSRGKLVERTAFRDEARVLFRVQRVAAGSRKKLLAGAARDEAGEELSGLVVREWSE
jgi:hypothetical protein